MHFWTHSLAPLSRILLKKDTVEAFRRGVTANPKDISESCFGFQKECFFGFGAGVHTRLHLVISDTCISCQCFGYHISQKSFPDLSWHLDLAECFFSDIYLLGKLKAISKEEKTKTKGSIYFIRHMSMQHFTMGGLTLKMEVLSIN